MFESLINEIIRSILYSFIPEWRLGEVRNDIAKHKKSLVQQFKTLDVSPDHHPRTSLIHEQSLHDFGCQE